MIHYTVDRRSCYIRHKKCDHTVKSIVKEDADTKADTKRYAYNALYASVVDQNPVNSCISRWY
jgi:hypothetical protein